MENLLPIEKGTYVIAVSGGVDSVVLLDVIKDFPDVKLVVAHFDHGMRPGSKDDAQFVADLAERYQLAYEHERQELGAQASEDTARRARYNFLFRLKAKHNAKSVMTAHHADDVIETMIINLIRGTGWRGLCSIQNTPELCRPFLAISKAVILKYASSHELLWKEDPTNNNEKYLRNEVRHRLMPLTDRSAWLRLSESQKNLAEHIDKELVALGTHSRYPYIMWPQNVALEVIKQKIGLTRDQAKYALAAIKTAGNGYVVEVGSKKRLMFTRDDFIVAPLEP